MSWLVALLTVALSGACVAEPAESCVGPLVTVTVTSSPGGTKRLDLQGRFFLDRCNDTDDREQAAPLQDIPVLVGRAGEALERLTTVNASGTLGVLRTVVDLPERLQTGQVDVAVGDAEVVRVDL